MDQVKMKEIIAAFYLGASALDIVCAIDHVLKGDLALTLMWSAIAIVMGACGILNWKMASDLKKLKDEDQVSKMQGF